MSMLSQVSTGSANVGVRVVIAAQEGLGKTTLACSTPRALLIPMEMGAGVIVVRKTPMVTEWHQLIGLMDEILRGAQSGTLVYRSLVFDSATALERIIHAEVIRSDPAHKPNNKTGLTMETSHGGYGKAYAVGNDLFDQFTRRCDELAVHGGINIILTCHVFASKVLDPANGEYNSWDLLLHSPKNEKTYGKRELITQWADIVGFLHEPMFVTKAKDETLARAISANQGRVLAVDRTPSWVAKNRYGLSGVIPIPKLSGWNAVAHAIYANTGIDTFNRD
jgi:hypothetical protein